MYSCFGRSIPSADSLFFHYEHGKFFTAKFHSYIYICVCVVIPRQTFVVSQLFSVARHARFSKLGSKPGWLIRQPKILPHSYEETRVSEGILNGYVSLLFCFTYIPLTSTENSNSFVKPCLTRVATVTSFARKLNPTRVEEHILSSTDCFVVSQLFSVTRLSNICLEAKIYILAVYFPVLFQFVFFIHKVINFFLW